MEFRDAVEYTNFRKEVRDFIDTNLPADWADARHDMEDLPCRGEHPPNRPEDSCR